MSKPDLNKMSGLLATKGTPVAPASDAIQRSVKEEKTKSSNDVIVNLAFKVPSSVRKRFKQAALDADITQNELIQRALELWEAHHAAAVNVQ